MTKNEYLSDLRARLSRLPKNELDDAMSFYIEFFEDAENDETAIESLGSPARLATQINAEYSARRLEENASAAKAEPENKDAEESDKDASDFSAYTAPAGGYTKDTYGQSGAGGADSGSNKTKNNSISWIWAVILGIFALPVALPIAIAALGVVIAIVAVCFALVVTLIAIVIALIVAGICTLFGIGTLSFIGLGGGLISIGGAIMLLGLALILIPLVIKFCVWLVRAIGKLVTGIFNGLKRRSEKK